MGAEGIILAKSLIPNLLRACAIVHWRLDHLGDDSHGQVAGTGGRSALPKQTTVKCIEIC